MKVKHWSKKLVLNQLESSKKIRSNDRGRLEITSAIKTPLKTNLLKDLSLKSKTPWRKRISSISKVLSQTQKQVVKKAFSQSYMSNHEESPVLMPLTIKNEEFPERYQHLRPRSITMCDRAELRNILNARLRQKIFERSMAAVIMEAERELYLETNNNNESVYVKIYREPVMVMARDEATRETVEEDNYMVMSRKK